MDRLANSATFNVIIVAVIALVIMAVLLFIFNDKITDSKENLDSCESKGGTCKLSSECKFPLVGIVQCPVDSQGQERVCCPT